MTPDRSKKSTTAGNYFISNYPPYSQWRAEELPDSMGIIMTQNEFAGLKLFMTHCNKCHPGGEQGAGPSLNDKPLPDFMIHFQIRQGLGDMPAFTKDELTKEEVQQIVRYVRFMRKNYAEANKG